MITFDSERFDDYDAYLAGEIAIERITYGFMMTGLDFQILPPRVLDKHPCDLYDGVNVYGGYYGPRTLTIKGRVIAETPAMLTNQIALLAALLTTRETQELFVSYLGGAAASIGSGGSGGSGGGYPGSVWTWQAMQLNPIERSADMGCRAQDLELRFEMPQPFAEGEDVEQETHLVAMVVMIP